jgi:hypothetical protein
MFQIWHRAEFTVKFMVHVSEYLLRRRFKAKLLGN